ncbi:MAG: hypothetical protein Kow00124_13660 [Anaerolineae bacterium]
MSADTVYIGVDTTAGTRPATCAVLNHRLQVLYLGEQLLEDLVGFIDQYPRAICGVDAPSGPNRGLLDDPDYRARVGLDPARDNYKAYRVAEYELRRRGIYIYNTSAEPERSAHWMEAGWRFYNRLYDLGFAAYPARGDRVLFETYPHAGYTVLIKKRPYLKTGLEGRVQRQLVLYEQGLDVPDAMDITQEWTRFRFLTGQVPMDGLYTHDELDALMAAYTAYLVGCEPDLTTAVGDVRDGQIVLPTGSLLDEY